MADVQAPQEGRSSAPGEFERGIAAVLYTDIDDSTGLWERHPDAMPRAIARHNALITFVVEANAGRVIKNLGALVRCRADARGDLWPLRLRMALRTVWAATLGVNR